MDISLTGRRIRKYPNARITREIICRPGKCRKNQNDGINNLCTARLVRSGQQLTDFSGTQNYLRHCIFSFNEQKSLCLRIFFFPVLVLTFLTLLIFFSNYFDTCKFSTFSTYSRIQRFQRIHPERNEGLKIHRICRIYEFMLVAKNWNWSLKVESIDKYSKKNSNPKIFPSANKKCNY